MVRAEVVRIASGNVGFVRVRAQRFHQAMLTLHMCLQSHIVLTAVNVFLKPGEEAYLNKIGFL